MPRPRQAEREEIRIVRHSPQEGTVPASPESRRTGPNVPAPMTAKDPEIRPGQGTPEGKTDADSPGYRGGSERSGKSGGPRHGSGQAGEAPGGLSGGKTSVPSFEAAAKSLRDPFPVPKQAPELWASAAEKAGVDGGRVRIVLSPDHLGTLDMNVTVRKESVEILMSVQREEAIHALRGSAAELRSALSDQGLRMESLSLQSSGRDARSDGGSSGGQGGFHDGRNMNGTGGHGGQPGHRDGEAGVGIRRPAGTASQRLAASGLSIFA